MTIDFATGHVRCAALLALMLGIVGCSPPSQVDRDNRKLVDAVMTAVTLKSTALLEESVIVAEQRFDDGHLADWEFEQISAVIGKARSGNWAQAEKLGYEFRRERPFVRDGQ